MKCHVNDDKLGTRTICVSTDLAPAAYTGSIHTLCSVSVYMCMRMLLDFSGWVDVLATQERREIKLWLTAVVRDIGEDPTLLSVALLSRNINNYWRPNAHQAYVCVRVCECVHRFLWFIVLTFFFSQWISVQLPPQNCIPVPSCHHFSFIILQLFSLVA